MSCSVWLSACPMCSSPVMFGGGRQIVYFGLGLCASATNRPSDSQRAYQPASTARGSKAFGIWPAFSVGFSFVFIRRVSSLGGDQERRRGGGLTRLSRRGYGHVPDAAHGGRNLNACCAGARPAPRSASWRPWPVPRPRTDPA